MTRRHIRWHRRIWIGCLLVLPAIVVLALVARDRRPMAAPVPSELSVAAAQADPAVPFSVVAASDGARALRVGGRALDVGDPLLYLAATAPNEGDPLPEGSVFLGRLPVAGSVELALPPDAGGFLVGYDLATARVLFTEALADMGGA